MYMRELIIAPWVLVCATRRLQLTWFERNEGREGRKKEGRTKKQSAKKGTLLGVDHM